MCGILCYPPRVRHFLTKDATRLLVQTSVLSLLNYCSVVWSGIETNHVNELQKVISFPARVLYRKRKQEHVSPLLQSLNWLRAQDIIGSAVRADFRRLYPANAKTPTCCPSDDNRTKVTNSVTSARSLWWHVGRYFWPADLTRTANPITLILDTSAFTCKVVQGLIPESLC